MLGVQVHIGNAYLKMVKESKCLTFSFGINLSGYFWICSCLHSDPHGPLDLEASSSGYCIFLLSLNPNSFFLILPSLLSFFFCEVENQARSFQPALPDSPFTWCPGTVCGNASDFCLWLAGKFGQLEVDCRSGR